MSIQRTTLPAESEDLAVLAQEARRRGMSLGALLKEMVGREAAAIRSSRRPRVGVIHRAVGIAGAMSEDADAPVGTAFRSP